MKTLKILTLLTIILAINFSFSSCSDDSDKEVSLNSLILGTWNVSHLGVNDAQVVFIDDGTAYVSFDKNEQKEARSVTPFFIKATYEINGNQLVLNTPGEEPEVLYVLSVGPTTMVVQNTESNLLEAWTRVLE